LQEKYIDENFENFRKWTYFGLILQCDMLKDLYKIIIDK
jgi:hypothetical protein